MSNFSPQFSPYPKPPLSYELRPWFGAISLKPVTLDDHQIWLDGEILSWHNLYHIELAQLDRIEIYGAAVSGIHGFYSSMFHQKSVKPEYAGILDELRVAIHEWLTRRSFYNSFKLLNWSYWMLLQGMNPIDVIWQHHKSLAKWSSCEKTQLQNLREWASINEINLVVRPR
ncbi:hypothetical protein IQ266_07085 [filamentous cyanobacterium LEGE 11480]|uniref:Uncharacterized protein n=1 Tax=Romeriopsis navalis LEGE 11480 TaxID=2777977 RepID=A0A928VJ32_9CYAN|nr:hypothetical protein [Romeriopsis navalis]MBE9029526.1 hypothetical protein [Romeriopsis navalis LEGE 11480]